MTSGAGRTPRLAGEGLVLEPVGPEHAAEMARVLADPALYAVTGGSPPDEAALRERYARQRDGSPDPAEEWHTWLVRDGADGPLTGFVQATVTGPGECAELAWVVGVPWQGRGLARRAAGVVVGEVRRRGIPVVVAHVRPGHGPSEAVARSLGLAPTDVVVDGETRWRLDLPGAEGAVGGGSAGRG